MNGSPGDTTYDFHRPVLAELDRESTRTRPVLENVPSGNDDWRPHPKSTPLGQLAGLVAMVLSDTLNHLVHHRDQLTVYLRLTDQKVPSVYGQSADDQTFR